MPVSRALLSKITLAAAIFFVVCTAPAALALKELLSPIMLEPVMDKKDDLYRLFEGEERNFKPYYVAHTKIQTLALLDEQGKGSNWYGMRWE